jgi:integron integrase
MDSNLPARTSHPNSPLLRRLRSILVLRHYSPRTQQAYRAWVIRFVRHHRLRHPLDLGEREVVAFLRHLREDRHVAAATQSQALAALLFLYRDVLDRPLRISGKIPRAKGPVRLPVVLTPGEVAAVLGELRGVYGVMGRLLYGSGLRISECISLRVKDVDFERGELVIRRGKGAKDRVTVLAASAAGALREHLVAVRRLHEADLARGNGRVALPTALERKYPRAAASWGWQWVFPATRTYRVAETGEVRRHHLDRTAMQRMMTAAVRRAGIAKPASCHTLRHSFATHLRRAGTTSGRCRSCWGTGT